MLIDKRFKFQRRGYLRYSTLKPVSNSTYMNSIFYSVGESFNTIPSFPPQESEMSGVDPLISLDSSSKDMNSHNLDDTLESLVPLSFRGNSNTTLSSSKSLKNRGKGMSIGRAFMLMQIESAAANSNSSHSQQDDCRREEQPAVHSQRIISFSPTIPDKDNNIHSSSSSSSSSSSYTRLRWTGELHERFVQCVNHLGGAKIATPREILRLMKCDGLTLFHVKSHLQKYRNSKFSSGSTEGMLIADALRVQTNIQKRLCKQLEEQKNLQLKIDEQGKQLQNMIDQLKKIKK